MHSFQNFIVKPIPNHPPPLETRIWKLVVRALVLICMKFTLNKNISNIQRNAACASTLNMYCA